MASGWGPRRWPTRTGGWTTRRWWTSQSHAGWACSWWPGSRHDTGSGWGCARQTWSVSPRCVWLPDTLISQETTAPTTGPRHIGKLAPRQLAGVDASAPSRRGAVNPALPSNDLPGGRTAEISPFIGGDGRPIRAADYKPIHRADTGPMQVVQPMRQISPVVIPAGALGGRGARLPIYDLLESDWFHRRGRSLQGAEAFSDRRCGARRPRRGAVAVGRRRGLACREGCRRTVGRRGDVRRFATARPAGQYRPRIGGHARRGEGGPGTRRGERATDGKLPAWPAPRPRRDHD